MSEQYFVRDRGHVQGPFTLEELERRVRTRRLARHHQLSIDGFAWRRASDLLPALFPVQAPVRLPPAGSPETIPLTIDPGEVTNPESDVLLEPQWIGQETGSVDPPRGEAGSRVFLMSVAGVVVLGTVAILAVLVMAVLGSRSPAGDRAIAAKIGPSMVTIKGIHPKTGKKTCFGLVVSKHHVVAPVDAATLDGLKVEALHDGEAKEWHSAHLVVADPVAGLCVLRCELGSDVAVAHLEDSKSLPHRYDALKGVTVTDDGQDGVTKWELKKILNEGEPDEQLLLVREDGADDDADSVTGAIVVDDDTRIVGLVVGCLPDGSCAAAPAQEIRSKKKESGKLPADHVLGRIDLPTPEGSMPPAAPATESGARRDGDEKPPGDETTTPVVSTGEIGAPPPDAKQIPASKMPRPAAADPRTQTPDGPEIPLDQPVKDAEPEPGEPSTPDKKGGESPGPARGDGQSRTPSRQGDLGDVVGAGAAIGQAVISLVPLPDLPPETANRLGKTFREDVCKQHRPVRGGGLVTRLRTMIDEICSAAEIDRKSITLTVVEDDELQAYAFVGGNIVVNTGFIEFAGGDADMERFVLGHEIGHIALGHVDEPFRRALLAGTLAPGSEVLADQVSLLIAESPLNQAHEEAADCFIVKVMRKRNWSAEGGVRFFDRLERQRGRSSEGNGSQSIESLFSTHPDGARRIDTIQHGCE